VSIRVLDQVFDRSRAKGATRNVLVALADAAHHDGVTWIPQGPPTDPKSIAYRAHAGVRTVERAIETLVALGELQVRRARRGRSYVNVYRVTVGSIAEQDVDYARLPFELDEPFETATGTTRRTTTRQDGGLNEDVQPASFDGSTRQNEQVQPANFAALRARVSSDPSVNHPATDAAARIERLQALGWTPTQIQLATSRPGELDRAIQLLNEASADPACRRPAALAWTRFRAGAQPADLEPAAAPGATGTRSARRPGQHRCPDPLCQLEFASAAAAAEHHRNVHADLDAAPPPIDITRFTRPSGRAA
jgi:hypothetical protein